MNELRYRNNIKYSPVEGSTDTLFAVYDLTENDLNKRLKSGMDTIKLLKLLRDASSFLEELINPDKVSYENRLAIDIYIGTFLHNLGNTNLTITTVHDSIFCLNQLRILFEKLSLYRQKYTGSIETYMMSPINVAKLSILGITDQLISVIHLNETGMRLG